MGFCILKSNKKINIMSSKRTMRKRRIVRRKVIQGFGTSLKKIREKRDLSRHKVANDACISPGTLQKIEEGIIKNPSIATVMDITSALGINEREMLGILRTWKKISREERMSREFDTR